MAPETPIELTSDSAEPVTVVSLPRRKAPVIAASALAVSLVTAVGVVVGMRLLAAAGDPAERMPASVAAFVATDLTPSRDQVRKLSKFTDPQASVDKLLAEMEAKPDLSGWTGPSLAAGIWLGKDEQPFVLVSLVSTDDDAATKGLTAVRSKQDIGFVVRKGQVLIAAAGKTAADNQAAAETAWAEAEKAPLAKHGRYADARKWLTDEQLAVVYVDLPALTHVMGKMLENSLKQMTGDAPRLGDVQASTPQPDPPQAELTGSLIAGVRVEDDGYLMRYRHIGGKAVQDGMVADALTRLAALPSASDVAAVAHVPGDLGSFMSMMPLLLGGIGGIGGIGGLGDLDLPTDVPDPADGGLTEAEAKELDALMAKPDSKLSEAEEKRLEELLDKILAGGPGDLNGGLGLTPSGDLFTELGESLTDATVAVAVTGIAETPVFRALIELAKDPEADLQSRLRMGQDKDVKVEVAGRAVTIASASFPAGGAKLADDPSYLKALAGCPTAAQVALYANAAKLLPAEARDRIGQVRTIGLCQSVQNGEPTGSVRLLVG